MNAHTNEEIRDLLVVVDPNTGLGFGDRVLVNGFDFAFPDVAYMASLGRRFARFLFDFGVPPTPERFNCTKYSKAAVNHAMLEHAKYSKEQSSFAIGVAYIVGDMGPHAVVGAIHSSGKDGNLSLKLYEPQPDLVDLICLKELPFARVGVYSFFSL